MVWSYSLFLTKQIITPYRAAQKVITKDQQTLGSLFDGAEKVWGKDELTRFRVTCWSINACSVVCCDEWLIGKGIAMKSAKPITKARKAKIESIEGNQSSLPESYG
ncbi:hypothetical protein EAY10_17315 [Vibrio anguillarum]|nr:hypothetical protein [Vibrio anguillarum]